MNRSLAFGLAVLALPACALEGSSDSTTDRPNEKVAQSSAAVTVERSFDVDFSTCTEMASLTPVPIANIRPRVPAQYAIANEANGTGFVVVRIASCAGVKINGADIGAGTVAQVGVNLVSPDGTGDLDNYTLYYDTTSAVLTARLRAFGFESRWLPGITYADAGTSLTVSVPGRGYSVAGPVVPPTGPGIPFEADWWSATRSSESKTATTLGSIQFSTAHMTIATQPGSELRHIIGAPTATFPIFDSYNHFATAHMTVTRRVTVP
jgi:hypothetical protein